MSRHKHTYISDLPKNYQKFIKDNFILSRGKKEVTEGTRLRKYFFEKKTNISTNLISKLKYSELPYIYDIGDMKENYIYPYYTKSNQFTLYPYKHPWVVKTSQHKIWKFVYKNKGKKKHFSVNQISINNCGITCLSGFCFPIGDCFDFVNKCMEIIMHQYPYYLFTHNHRHLEYFKEFNVINKFKNPNSGNTVYIYKQKKLTKETPPLQPIKL